MFNQFSHDFGLLINHVMRAAFNNFYSDGKTTMSSQVGRDSRKEWSEGMVATRQYNRNVDRSSMVCIKLLVCRKCAVELHPGAQLFWCCVSVGVMSGGGIADCLLIERVAM